MRYRTMNVPVRLANFRFEIFYGKRKSSRVPKGNVYLKTALVEAAMEAKHRRAIARPDSRL